MDNEEPKLPPDVQAALRENKLGEERWKALSPSHRREYLKWIDEAKRPETRKRRIADALKRLTRQ